MFKAIALTIVLGSLTACTQDAGRKTNCFSSNRLSLVQSDSPATPCQWEKIGG